MLFKKYQPQIGCQFKKTPSCFENIPHKVALHESQFKIIHLYIILSLVDLAPPPSSQLSFDWLPLPNRRFKKQVGGAYKEFPLTDIIKTHE